MTTVVETRETRGRTEVSMELPPQELQPIEFQVDAKKPEPPTEEATTVRKRVRESTSMTVKGPSERHTRGRTTASMDVADTREPQPIEIEMTVDKPERPKPKERPKEPLMPPQFVRRVRTVTVTEGESAVFEVEVTGLPMPDIIWLKDSEPVENIPEFKITTTDGVSILVLGEAFPEDTGKVVCKAENRAGVVTCSAKLIVIRG